MINGGVKPLVILNHLLEKTQWPTTALEFQFPHNFPTEKQKGTFLLKGIVSKENE